VVIAANGSRKNYSHIEEVIAPPNLIQIQLDSFTWFQEEGIPELLGEVSPIQDATREGLPSDLLKGRTPREVLDMIRRGEARPEPSGGRFSLTFISHRFGEPKHSEEECREKDLNFAAPLYVTARLIVKETGEVKDQELFLGDVPLMTDRGTFIINGAERVVVSQLVRSPGAYFTLERDPTTGRELCFAKLIPNRGAWLEFEISNKGIVSVKVDRRRKMPVTLLLRALGYTDDEILSLFSDVEAEGETGYIQTTLEKEPHGKTTDEALIDFYRRLRPGEPSVLDNAKTLLYNLFFNSRRYDLARVGRYKLNRSLGLQVPDDVRILLPEDIIALIRQMVRVQRGLSTPNDIDHLGNRRVRAVGELIQNQFRVGLLRMERVARERMTLVQPEGATPGHLVNVRPVVAALREFFGGSQLSQFMDQTNPLAELTHKRRLSALGPGGLSRERAGFDVRDVHNSHYGRICPIETPEGPNIGLLGSLATYAKINRYGFIETPYRRVLRELPNKDADALLGHSLREAVKDEGDSVVAEAGVVVNQALARKLGALPAQQVKVRPFVSPETAYLAADEEELYDIAQANTQLTEQGEIMSETIEVRRRGEPHMARAVDVDYMDVSPKQIFSVSTALIPFLEHDDANRALMGSNMQRQAVPLLRPDVPLVGTGMEARVASDSGQIVLSRVDGVVVSADANRVVIRDDEGREHTHRLRKFERSNQGTIINQRPFVVRGERVRKGDPIADSSSTVNGELALGQNVLCAFMSWEGYNFEDAIILSETVVREDKFTSIHIEKYEIEARDTKLGREEITRDIPNVGEDALRDLDEHGIIRIGAEVSAGDILVGKITPKGETELSPEEKLLRAIFSEKAREVKDSSLRVPHGERGKVIDVKVLTRENKDELSAGVNELVRVWVAQTRKISVGDKMAGRHGNKGVISRILPIQDMPFLPDGAPVEIILNPIGVPSRMNLGQILETHIGAAAHDLGFRVITPVFDGADPESIEDALGRAWIAHQSGAIVLAEDGAGLTFRQETAEAWLSDRGIDPAPVFSDRTPGVAKEVCLRIWLEQQGLSTTDLEDGEAVAASAAEHYRATGNHPPIFGKVVLRDGRSGEPFGQPVTVGYIYMLKLIHLVEDKIHARSTGPYSLITQQPLGGKAQFGGQRFGEMEVWALEAYSAAYNLQEMLTIKSDDVQGRQQTYEAIVKGEDVIEPGIPESFHVLQKELQSLGLAVELLQEDEVPALELSLHGALRVAEDFGDGEGEDLENGG
jgi:DNA-directed RNA polymerase subunit beta